MSETFSVFGSPLCSIVDSLNYAIKGNERVAITASKRGITLSLNGKKICRGRTPTEFHEAFQAERKKAAEGTR